MKKGVCYVVGAGEFHHDPILPRKDDMVIAADGGTTHLDKIGVRPDFILGDFDSLPDPERYDNVIRHPKEKDDTDTSLAIQLGLRQGYATFVLHGCTGGRSDHTYANLQTLCLLSKRNAIGYLVGKNHVATMITNDTLTVPDIKECKSNPLPWLPKQKGYVSVFSFGESAKGVTLQGLKYPLTNATLQNDRPIGVSNEFTGNHALITVEEGSLLIIWER